LGKNIGSTLLSSIQKRKKDNSDVTVGLNHGVASYPSNFECIPNPEMGITRIKRARRPMMENNNDMHFEKDYG
jgi:hypothetical protein